MIFIYQIIIIFHQNINLHKHQLNIIILIILFNYHYNFYYKILKITFKYIIINLNMIINFLQYLANKELNILNFIKLIYITYFSIIFLLTLNFIINLIYLHKILY
jgi:hypothetical protein